MLPQWLRGWFTEEYQKEISSQSQYETASRYLRRQMQELVACPYPDRETLSATEDALQELTKELEALLELLPLLHSHCQQLQAGGNATRQPLSAAFGSPIHTPKKEFSGGKASLTEHISFLNTTLQAAADAHTYEQVHELSEQIQDRLTAAMQELTCLRQMKTAAPSREWKQQNIDYEEYSQLQAQMENIQRRATHLEMRLHELYHSLSDYMDTLNKALSLHRNFLQKNGNAQLQFEALNRQVPALLHIKTVHSDWFNLVTSWYKANNLAANTIKTLSPLAPALHKLTGQCRENMDALAGLSRQLKTLYSENISHRPLVEGESSDAMVDSFQKELNIREQQLQEITLRHDTLLEEARKKALAELEHLKKLCRELDIFTCNYVSPKAAFSTRHIFDEIKNIMTSPYCLRSVHHSPVPRALLTADNYNQYLAGTNAAYIKKQLHALSHYFDHIQGKSLTLSQRTAILTDADYVQIMGGKGFGKSFTLHAKMDYLLHKKNLSPKQVLFLTPGKLLEQQALSWLQGCETKPFAGVTRPLIQRDDLQNQLPQCEHLDFLLPILELHEYLAPTDTTLALSANTLSGLSGPERPRQELLYQELRLILQTYRKILTQKQLVDQYQLLHTCTRLFHSGQLQNTYNYCLVDDFPLLSPLEFELIRTLLRSNPHTKLFCSGEHWEPIPEHTYIRQCFNKLPWEHYLVQGLLTENQRILQQRNYAGGYLSLTETKGEVILLTPPRN
ncbi:MAG: UvrD-helicase domain-containing protein [Lachnospiraceae bacterium]|nr:UvrD-helicase domain-containing protein [Lachnospiraceae bacterium]